MAAPATHPLQTSGPGAEERWLHYKSAKFLLPIRFPPFPSPSIHKQKGLVLEETLSRVAAFPSGTSWSHNTILLKKDRSPKKVCPHSASRCLQLHMLNKMKIMKTIESFLISHATQDEDLRLMQLSSFINLKTKRRFFPKLKYVWRIHNHY